MPVSDAVRIRHILDAARQATAFVQWRSRRDLDTDPMLSLSLVRLLEIIGEAARGISPAVREAHPEIAWSKMAGMRDRLSRVIVYHARHSEGRWLPARGICFCGQKQIPRFARNDGRPTCKELSGTAHYDISDEKRLRKVFKAMRSRG
jgi:uncharacterized protein with HEPN domain